MSGDEPDCPAGSLVVRIGTSLRAQAGKAVKPSQDDTRFRDQRSSRTRQPARDPRAAPFLRRAAGASPAGPSSPQTAAKELVGDVERREHRDLQRIARCRLDRRCLHLVVDVLGVAARCTPVPECCESDTADRGFLDGDDRVNLVVTPCSSITRRGTGRAGPRPSTLPQSPHALETEALELIEHFGHAHPDQIAFLAQHRHLRGGAFDLGKPLPRRIVLARQALVLLGGARLLGSHRVQPAKRAA